MVKRVAVIGAGIAGLSAAWLLRDACEVTLYEGDARAGGHADTQLVRLDGEDVPVDTGFIVYNERNYPNLTAFFAALGVVTHDSNMSFGVSKNNGAFEYGGGDLKQLFAQPLNFLKPRYLAMLRDILRFNKQAPALLKGASTQSLGDYLAAEGYGPGFIEDYLLPMGAAIWSASVEGMKAFPARNFVRFFVNHGLLNLKERPQWKTVTGGSRTYVARVVAELGSRVRLGAGVRGVRRDPDGIEVMSAAMGTGGVEVYDEVVFACHADQALALIAGPTAAEREILGAIRFQENAAVLHQDVRVMPIRRLAWCSWNYLSADAADHGKAISLTYWMNLLQGMKTKLPLLVTLNASIPLDPAKVLLRKSYRHPQFDAPASRAQERLAEIQGCDRLWFAGAWTGWGFHEDGIASAVLVANALGVRAPWQS